MMKYVLIFLPLIASAASIRLDSVEELHMQDELMLRKFKPFVHNQQLLPHSARPHMILQKTKRSEEDEPHFDFGNTDIELASFNPKKFEKGSPIPEACKKDEHSIETSGDLHQLQVQCEDILGTIRFLNYVDPVIDFGNIQSIKGSVQIEDCVSVVKVQGNRLEKIGGTFSLQGLTSLVSVDMPSLKEVSVIDWRVVPILNNAILNDGLSGVKSITISDSSLSAIEGFKKVDRIEVFNVNNNRFLETIKANIKYVTKQLSIHANAKESELEMPELVSAENITVRDTSLVYFPKLETVGSSLEFIENQFKELEIPTLKFVGGTLGVIDNINLGIADFGNVTDIQGGLMVANNTKLDKIDFFSKLKQIGGAIHFEGRFHDTEFPQLKLVKGSALIRTNSEMMDCSKWTTPKNARSIIRGGKISCTSGRKQKAQKISEDGTVLQESESTANTETDSTTRRPGIFSKISKSGGTINKVPGIVWILCAISASCCVHWLK